MSANSLNPPLTRFDPAHQPGHQNSDFLPLPLSLDDDVSLSPTYYFTGLQSPDTSADEPASDYFRSCGIDDLDPQPAYPPDNCTFFGGGSCSPDWLPSPTEADPLYMHSPTSNRLALPTPSPTTTTGSSMKLRTASRKRRQPKKPTSSSGTHPYSEDTNSTTASDLSPEELRTRRCHNLVEKQYRSRLNAQFERLLAVLPPERQRRERDGESDDEAGDVDGSSSSSKRISKAEVLDAAVQRIRQLEVRNRKLRKEREGLRRLNASAGDLAVWEGRRL